MDQPMLLLTWWGSAMPGTWLLHAKISLRSFRYSRLENFISRFDSNWAGRWKERVNSSSKQLSAPEQKTKMGLFLQRLLSSTKRLGNSACNCWGKDLQAMLDVLWRSTGCEPLVWNLKRAIWWETTSWKVTEIGKLLKNALSTPDRYWRIKT